MLVLGQSVYVLCSYVVCSSLKNLVNCWVSLIVLELRTLHLMFAVYHHVYVKITKFKNFYVLKSKYSCKRNFLIYLKIVCRLLLKLYGDLKHMLSFHDPLLVRVCGWNQEPLHFLACICLSTQSIPSHRHSLKPLLMKPNMPNKWC